MKDGDFDEEDIFSFLEGRETEMDDTMDRKGEPKGKERKREREKCIYQ